MVQAIKVLDGDFSNAKHVSKNNIHSKKENMSKHQDNGTHKTMKNHDVQQAFHNNHQQLGMNDSSKNVEQFVQSQTYTTQTVQATDTSLPATGVSTTYTSALPISSFVLGLACVSYVLARKLKNKNKWIG